MMASRYTRAQTSPIVSGLSSLSVRIVDPTSNMSYISVGFFFDISRPLYPRFMKTSPVHSTSV